jgi:coproporphyrinogen III oxidase
MKGLFQSIQFQFTYSEFSTLHGCYRFTINNENTSLAATMVRWFEGGVNQGLLPMTISEEESNLFCACHLLNCDEGQGQ